MVFNNFFSFTLTLFKSSFVWKLLEKSLCDSHFRYIVKRYRGHKVKLQYYTDCGLNGPDASTGDFLSAVVIYFYTVENLQKLLKGSGTH